MNDLSKCRICGDMAVWLYMPEMPCLCYCDVCVPRGCSCNFNTDTGEQDRDKQGRLLPCCEYEYYENGIESEETNEREEYDEYEE